ncbi:unnamed protein product [Symbiodinium natans]|uniref:Uncharacterized protein n=1 Tax=Symbiodinium natans TaxID=878477 RepID=A0A812I4A3_9DINO|nr:unnamed protein product [Symbiodinium natans]
MKDELLEAALKSALTADNLRSALRVPRRPGDAGRSQRLDAAVAQLHDRVRSAYRSAYLEPEAESKAAKTVAVAPDASYRVRLSFADGDTQQPLPTRTSEITVDQSQKATASLTCTHCRRPLKIDMMLSDPMEKSVKYLGKPRHAYVAVLPDGKTTSFLQAWLLGLSLAAHGDGQGQARPERMLIHSPSVPRPYLQVLGKVWQLTTEPLGSWPAILSHPTVLNPGQNRLMRLRALGLKFDKVLVIALGIVATDVLDDVFEASCPAFVAEKTHAGPQQAGLPLMLLPCSHQAMRRVASDTGQRSQSVAFPPRCVAGQGPVEGDEVLGYLKSFYRTFSQGDMQELPSELCLRMKFYGVKVWRHVEQLLRDGASTSASSDTEDLEGLLQLLRGNSGHNLSQTLTSVDNQRCGRCKAFDSRGTLDPLDGLWRCRFCWEHMLLDSALKDPSCIPMPFHEIETLQKDLGDCFVPGERQRWRWKEWERDRTWVEFRPKGVLWHSRNRVGAWEMWTDRGGKQQLSMHFVDFDEDGHRRPETRHLLEFHNTGWARFEEYKREHFQPLGFVSEGRNYRDQKLVLHPPGCFQPPRRPPADEQLAANSAKGVRPMNGTRDLVKEPKQAADQNGTAVNESPVGQENGVHRQVRKTDPRDSVPADVASAESEAQPVTTARGKLAYLFGQS